MQGIQKRRSPSAVSILMVKRQSTSPFQVLGEVAAESDAMLDGAFYESRDFRTLLSCPKTAVVVGRRGTGKSALYRMLAERWRRTNKKKRIIQVIPSEESVIGLRGIGSGLLSRYNYCRSFFKHAWEACFLNEAIHILCGHYKFRGHPDAPAIIERSRAWIRSGPDPTARLHELAKACVANGDPESVVSSARKKMGLDRLRNELIEIAKEANPEIVYLVDRTDDGYEPDEAGSAIVAGLIASLIEITSAVSNANAIVFLRDNIARALATQDPDYSRSIESKVIRLHWNHESLFELVAARIRCAFGLEEGSSRALWNRFVIADLHGMEGFRRCLRHTLYRPRDALTLFNKAYYEASKDSTGDSPPRITSEAIAVTAKTISKSRLSDLISEYEPVSPALPYLVRNLAGSNSVIERDCLHSKVSAVVQNDSLEPRAQQDIRLIRTPQAGIRLLYEMGVIGVEDATGSTFAFCHDGHRVVDDVASSGRFMVHPCYWIALDIDDNPLDENAADSIYDEYDTDLIGREPAQRIKRIGQLAGMLDRIDHGNKTASEYERWCHDCLVTLFAGALRNMELKPNKNAPSRRDIVGAVDPDTGGVWKRLREDYQVRHVVFEIKNHDNIGPDDYRQIADYLNDLYGRCGFILARTKSALLNEM